jgi:GMP synthase-like glutamine amidotransferase
MQRPQRGRRSYAPHPSAAIAAVKPVLVLQHLHFDGPAYLKTWLDERGVAVDLRNTEAGDEFPPTIEDHAALAILGGAMSANDPLPSLRRAEALIQQAIACDVPVIGHCLGGQLMARALGARVVRSPAPEIGWQPMAIDDEPLARAWFGTDAQTTVMHWHFEAFELPAGAVRLATSAACPNQAFAIGPHLAMQFHIEIDDAKLLRWSDEHEPGWIAAQGRHPTVQDRASMRADAARRMASHQRLAARIYRRWLSASAWDDVTS